MPQAAGEESQSSMVTARVNVNESFRAQAESRLLVDPIGRSSGIWGVETLGR
jgi:hypothetical protein